MLPLALDTVSPCANAKPKESQNASDRDPAFALVMASMINPTKVTQSPGSTREKSVEERGNVTQGDATKEATSAYPSSSASVAQMDNASGNRAPDDAKPGPTINPLVSGNANNAEQTQTTDGEPLMPKGLGFLSVLQEQWHFSSLAMPTTFGTLSLQGQTLPLQGQTFPLQSAALPTQMSAVRMAFSDAMTGETALTPQAASLHGKMELAQCLTEGKVSLPQVQQGGQVLPTLNFLGLQTPLFQGTHSPCDETNGPLLNVANKHNDLTGWPVAMVGTNATAVENTHAPLSVASPVVVYSAPVLQVSDSITWMVRSQVQGAELQLHPASLGRVVIQLSVEGNEVHARLRVAEASTVPILQEHRASLENALKSQGLELGSFDLQQGHRDGTRFAHTFQPQAFPAASGTFTHQDNAPVSATSSPYLGGAQLLEVFA